MTAMDRPTADPKFRSTNLVLFVDDSGAVLELGLGIVRRSAVPDLADDCCTWLYSVVDERGWRKTFAEHQLFDPRVRAGGGSR